MPRRSRRYRGLLLCTIFVHCALVWGSWAAAHSQPSFWSVSFGRFMVLKRRNFLRGALPRTPLGLPAPDLPQTPGWGGRPRPRVRRCRRPEAELRLQAKVARCRLSSKKIAIYYYTGGGRPLFGDPYKQIGERVEAVKAQRLLQEDEDAPSPGDRRATLLLRLGADGKTGKSTWKRQPAYAEHSRARSWRRPCGPR